MQPRVTLQPPRKTYLESEYETEDEEEMDNPNTPVSKPEPKQSRNTNLYAYRRTKTGFIEPVKVTGAPSPSVESAPAVVALSESSSDGESTEGVDDTPRWQEVGGRSKRKREGPSVRSKPPAPPLPSPASPNLEPLVIVEEDQDPKVLCTCPSPDKG